MMDQWHGLRDFLGLIKLDHTWTVGNIALVRKIPAGTISDRAANRLDFVLPDAALIPTDTRRLAFYFKYLLLQPAATDRSHSLPPDRIAALDRERAGYNERQEQLRAQITEARGLGELERALALCEEAAGTFPNWGEPGRIKSEILTDLLQPVQARAAIEQALAAEPANDQLRIARASLAGACHQYESAAIDLRKILTQHPDEKWPLFMLGTAYARLGWLDLAATTMRRLRSPGRDRRGLAPRNGHGREFAAEHAHGRSRILRSAEA